MRLGFKAWQKTKLYGPLLWMRFNCLKTTEPLRGDSLLFTTKFSEIPGTYWKVERLNQPWNHPVVLNKGPQDRESSALTTGPLTNHTVGHDSRTF